MLCLQVNEEWKVFDLPTSTRTPICICQFVKQWIDACKYLGLVISPPNLMKDQEERKRVDINVIVLSNEDKSKNTLIKKVVD